MDKSYGYKDNNDDGTTCLFFLMVLVSCHTISKSIANEDEIDDICDSLNNVDFKRERKGKHDRFIHQYKRENSNEVTKPFKNVKSTVTTKKTKPHEKSTEDIATKPIHTSIHSKLGKMWRKFRIKGKKDDKDKELSRKIRGKGGGRRRLNRHNTVPFHKHVTTVDERKYFDSNEVFTKRDRKTISKKRRKNYNQVVLAKRKQSVKDDESSINLTDLSANQTKPFSRNKEEICITPHKEYYKSTTVHNFKTATIKTYETPGFDDGLTNSLASTTTNKNNLNFLYRLNKYQKKSAIQNIKPNVFSEPTTESVEYLSTAQIEALLNDIKVKAVQMIAHQSPAITETIANAVTKIAFETNPILKHLKINSPGHALSNFVSLDPINKCCDKRKVNYMDMMINIPSNEPSMISSTETHNIEARSISRDAYTIAQSIEDKLQQELKNAFEKVKSQICHKDITKVAPKKTATMMAPTVVPSIETTKPFNANKKNTNAETLLRTNRGKTSKQHENIGNTENNKKAEALTRSSSTIDDYAMLTVCEHMLTKSRENSVLKLLMAPDAIMRKKKEALRLSKRNLETLTDLSLKENIQNIYNDEEEMPEESIDYGSDSNAKTIEMSATPDETKNNEEKEQGQATVKEDSLEGLITKLAYNDYVNGYKYYLNFQREQGDQKFSNLIKYQAHMHHNVDDIGKFILSKIPQIPTKRYKRNFFDNTDTLDDESWFKKHFYLFIENGTPKKYHTSQTVSLKSPITETRNKVASYNTENVIDKPVLENKCVDTESTDVNWSEPPKDYIHVPSYRSSTMNYVQLIKVDKEKLKTVKNENKDEKKNEIKILLDEELERHKRNAKKNEYSKIQSKRSTTTDAADFSKKSDIKSRKYGYVDVNLIRTTTAKIKNKKHKNNKLKNFFDKFRLKTNKKVNPKKAKRSSQIRVQRFFGFKNMFKTKPTDKPIPPTTTPREPSLDYDVTMTKNHYFKPFKFNNPLGVKEIQNMIPNITYDIPYGANINNLMPPVKYNIPETSIKPGDSHVFQAPKVTQAIQLKLPDSKIQNSLQDLKFRSRISVTDTPLNIVAPNGKSFNTLVRDRDPSF